MKPSHIDLRFAENPGLPEVILPCPNEKKIEIILVNRNKKVRKFTLDVFKNGGTKLFSKNHIAQSKAVIIFTLSNDELSILGNNSGYFSVSGISSPWGRPAIMRHFENGAISIMHC